MDSNSEWIIAESENYCIKGFYEEVELFSRKNGDEICCIGDFYGDPVCGIIDWNERFCVVVGCGCIIYFLRKPFEPYMYDRKTSQWVEYGRKVDNIDWFESVQQISDDEIELTDEDGKKIYIKIYI